MTDPINGSIAATRLRAIASRASRESGYALGAVVGQRRYETFALLGHARTGSNYVANGLATSSSLRMYHELFADHMRGGSRHFNQALQTLRSRQPRRIRSVGFKLFYYHLSEAEWERIVGELSLRIVHLTRRNRLRTLLSLEIARKTDSWTGQRPLPLVDRRVTMNTEALRLELDRIGRYEQRARERLRHADLLEVVYEDVVADPEGQFGRLGRFLGVHDLEPRKIALPRQNPESLELLIENFNAVTESLRATPYSSYVDDAWS